MFFVRTISKFPVHIMSVDSAMPWKIQDNLPLCRSYCKKYDALLGSSQARDDATNSYDMFQVADPTLDRL